jgi:hypothetical protein
MIRSQCIGLSFTDYLLISGSIGYFCVPFYVSDYRANKPSCAAFNPASGICLVSAVSFTGIND